MRVAPTNILSIEVTTVMSQLFKAKVVKEEQPQKDWLRLVMLDVSQALTSKVVSEEQPWKIRKRLVTLDVSQALTSKVVSEEQP